MRKKTNFFVPIHTWFKGELLDITKQILSREEIAKQGIFDYRHIEKIWKRFNNSRLFYARQLWSLLCFQIWHKLYIEKGMTNYNSKTKII